jgi:cysteinylglycine-S-conjugate dipeptidase
VELRDRVEKLMPQARDELAELVAMGSGSVAGPGRAPRDGCDPAARWVRDKFAELGFADARVQPAPAGSATVIGLRPAPRLDRPTVLIYARHDIPGPADRRAWQPPPDELTERGGRWYGHGTADWKGNVVMHLAALRALGDTAPVNIKLAVEGPAEHGAAPGLKSLLPRDRAMLRADAILITETGNVAVGRPALTVSLRGQVRAVLTVEALASAAESGAFGGAAPDALAALVAMLATLRDTSGNTTIAGLDNTQRWQGEQYVAQRLRRDASFLRNTTPLGDGTISDMLWARPALTVLSIDRPADERGPAHIAPRAVARLDLRIPPGIGRLQAQKALGTHLHDVAPWGVRVDVHVESSTPSFQAGTEGPAYAAMGSAMHEAFGRPMTLVGHGGSIPVCSVLADAFPEAELLLAGVGEPLARANAPDESVDPEEIRAMALTEALFFQRLGNRRRGG